MPFALTLLSILLLSGAFLGFTAVVADRNLVDEGADAATAWNTFTINLYVNNVTPTTASVFADFTAPSYTGNGAQAIAAAAAGSIVVDTITITTEQFTFAVTGTGGSEVAYGFYVYDGSNRLIAAGRFPTGPFNMQTIGDTIKVTVAEAITRV